MKEKEQLSLKDFIGQVESGERVREEEQARKASGALLESQNKIRKIKEDYSRLVTPEFLAPFLQGFNLIDRIRPGVVLFDIPPNGKTRGYLDLEMPYNSSRAYYESFDNENVEIIKDRSYDCLREYYIYNYDGKISVKRRYGCYRHTGRRWSVGEGNKPLEGETDVPVENFLQNSDQLLFKFTHLSEDSKALTRDEGIKRQLFFLEESSHMDDIVQNTTLLYPPATLLRLDADLKNKTLQEAVFSNTQMILNDINRLLRGDPEKQKNYELLLSQPVIRGLFEAAQKIGEYYPTILTINDPRRESKDVNIELVWSWLGNASNSRRDDIKFPYIDCMHVGIIKNGADIKGVRIETDRLTKGNTFVHDIIRYDRMEPLIKPSRQEITLKNMDNFSETVKNVLGTINLNKLPDVKYIESINYYLNNYLDGRRILLF